MDDFGIDSHKLHYHVGRVNQWLQAKSWDEAKKIYPIYWEVTTSAFCQHRCNFCSVDAIGYPAIYVNENILLDRMTEASELGVKSVMFAGTGEPLIHKKISGIVSGATLVAGLDAAMTTNGVLLNRLQSLDLLTWVKVSLNAGKAETYSKIHQTDINDWFKVWRNIENASKRKGDCTLGVQCVVLPDNVDEMDVLAQTAKDAGADYLVLKPYSQGTFSLTHQYEGTTYEKWDTWLSAVEHDHTKDGFKVIYRREAMKQESERHHYEKCRSTPNFWTYTLATGEMFACSAHLLDKRFSIGNINTQSFKEIWEGPERQRVWEMMKTFDISQCRLNCRMDKQNRYLAELALGVSHANFI